MVWFCLSLCFFSVGVLLPFAAQRVPGRLPHVLELLSSSGKRELRRFRAGVDSLGLGRTGLRREHRRGVQEGKAPGTAVSLLSALAGVLVLAAHSVTAIPGTHRCKLPLGGFVLGSGGLFLRRGSNR